VVPLSEPPRRLEFQVTAGPGRPGVFELSQAAEGSTRVRFSLDLEPSGAMKLMTPMITGGKPAEVACLRPDAAAAGCHNH